MTAGTLVLLRHGRTAYNASMRLQGQVDIPLDAVGRWHAALRAQASARGHSPRCVVACSLFRDAVTARVLAAAIGADVAYDPRLRERGFGEWEGLTGPEIAERWPEEYAAWRQGEEPVRAGAESKADVAARLVASVTEHVESLERDDTLVVVSHGAAITLAVTALLGLDPEGWRGISGLHNVHWSHLHRSAPAATPAWRLVAHNVGAGFPLDEWNAGPDWNLEPVSA